MLKIKRVLARWLVFMMLSGILLGMTSQTTSAFADSSWRAKYWNNTALAGAPVLERNESHLNHDWGTDSPAAQVNADNFSARWSRTIHEPPGTYRFVATTDDGMRVWLDNVMIIDSWYDSQAHAVTVDVYLSDDDHHLKVEYYDSGGGAVAQLYWAPPPGTFQNWFAEYFDNSSLQGSPVRLQNETAINYDWGFNAPVPETHSDDFSVRWSRTLSFDPGPYRFTVTADDGVRLWVNNVLIIDQWHNHPATTYSGEIALSGGSVPIKLEYYEDKGAAVVQLSWVKLAGSAAPSPSPAPVPAAPVTQTAGGWLSEYYNNVSLDGSPVLVRNDAAINFTWGSSSPAPNVVDHDNFSVRWTGTLNLSPGQYIFTANVDGGVRLWVNGQLIIDQWNYIYRVETYHGVINVAGGPATVRMEFFEHVGLAEARLSWSAAESTVASTGTAVQSPATQSSPGGLTATMVNAVHLSVRSGPGFDHEPFAYLSRGQVVTLTGYRDVSASWIQIRLADGRTGWVGASFLASDTPFINLAIWTG